MNQTEAKTANGTQTLPDGWRWARLGEVARVFAGSAAPQGEAYFDGAGPPFVRVSDLAVEKRTTYLTLAKDHLSRKALEQNQLVSAKRGTILFPKSGAAIKNNNRAILGTDAYIVSHLMAVEPGESASSLWLYWWLCQLDMTRHSDNEAYPSLRQSTVENISVPLPPHDEQERIAGVLREQLALVERARSATEAQLEAAKVLPAAYLRRAFDSPEAKRWPRKPFLEVCDFRGGTQPPKSVFVREPRDGYVRLLQIQDFKTDEYAVYVPDSGRLQKCDETDVLIGRYGASVGKILRGKAGAHNVAIVKTLPDDTILSKDFLYYLLKEKEFQSVIRTIGARAAQAGFNKADFAEVTVYLPPIHDQQHIASQLSAQMASAERLCQTLTEQLDAINTLPAALLRRAFSGEL